MEQFTEEHAKRLLGTEWMAKTDAGTSTPYLFKFDFSPVDLSCVIMITDTKKVWAEVVNDKLLARRWRACNSRAPEPFLNPTKEDSWRESTLELLSKAHTIGGISDSSFEVVESKYSDLCLDLEWEAFKWRWEAYFLGYPQSSEIISKHLVLPLISLNHLTFSAAEVVGEMSDPDVEKVLDKLGRTARRTADTHIKNALSKPRLATCINRMTALFNFLPDLPRVTSIAEKPLLEIEEGEGEAILDSRSDTKGKGKYVASPKPNVDTTLQKHEQNTRLPVDNPESATESDSDSEKPANKSGPASGVAAGSPPTVQGAPLQHPIQPQTPPLPPPTEVKPSSDSDSPQRPIKKIKTSVPESSDDDSENAHKKPGAVGGTKRGTRQPIKRGGKRF